MVEAASKEVVALILCVDAEEMFDGTNNRPLFEVLCASRTSLVQLASSTQLIDRAGIKIASIHASVVDAIFQLLGDKGKSAESVPVAAFMEMLRAVVNEAITNGLHSSVFEFSAK